MTFLALRLVLAGFGRIGRELVKIALERRDHILRRYDLDLSIVGVSDRSGAAISQSGLDLPTILKAKDATGRISAYPTFGKQDMLVSEVLDQVNADVLVELTPTDIRIGQPGIDNMQRAIARGLHIVTTNKGALAVGYKSLSEKAQRQGVALKFGGAAHIPIPCVNIESYTSLGPSLVGVEGIVNATTNYVLTQIAGGTSMKDAISMAQNEKITEHDLNLDLGGWDTACKMVILANWLLRKESTLRDVKTKGIADLQPITLIQAKRQGYVIKAIGEIRKQGTKITLKSYPKKLRLSNLLAGVEGFHKAMIFHTTQGDIFVKTEQAGPKASAYAVMQDIIDIERKTSSGGRDCSVVRPP